MTFGLARAGNYLDWLGAWVRTPQPGATIASAWMERRAAFDRADAYYRNTIYAATDDGGYRDEINRALKNAAAADLMGLYNPVASVVGLYQHVFGGRFGTSIHAIPGKTGDPRLVDYLADIWQWSNMDIEKQPLCTFGANYGTAGIRIVADVRRQRVYLKAEHPAILRDTEVDDRGNVTGVELEYAQTRGLGADQETITIREVLTRDSLQTYKVKGVDSLVLYDPTTGDEGEAAKHTASMATPFGVVPYVLLRHNYSGEAFGANAYSRALPAIDRLNALLSHIDVQIHQHVRTTWAVAASGAPPEEFVLGGKNIIYFNTEGGTAPPVFQALIANLDIASATAQAQAQLGMIEDLLPELKAIAGTYLSGQSGETIAELRKPAEDAVLLARANYEDALIRAQQIALSFGVWMGIFDFGVGSGPEAADAAYHTGLEDHTFNERPALTVDRQTTQPQQAGTPTPDAARVETTQQVTNAPA